MRRSIIFASLLVLVGTSPKQRSYARTIVDVRERREDFRTGGRVIVGQTIINHRDSQKDSGKPIRIRRVW